MKVILVTGASSGFGRLTALEAVGQGHRVFAGVRQSKGKNREAAKTIVEEAGGGANDKLDVVDLDIADSQSITSAVGFIEKTAGRLDVLVNNAAVMPVGVTEAYTDEQVLSYWNTNVMSMLRLARAVLPGMRQRKSGLMVHVSSIAGRLIFPFFGIYCATKFAMEALGETFRYELASFGVDSVIVEPGPFPTRLIANSSPPGNADLVESYGMLGKIPGMMLDGFAKSFEQPGAPHPSDVARAIVKLIGTPFGHRPLRTVVGADFGAETLNEAARPVQDGLLSTLEMRALAEQSSPPAGRNPR